MFVKILCLYKNVICVLASTTFPHFPLPNPAITFPTFNEGPVNVWDEIIPLEELHRMYHFLLSVFTERSAGTLLICGAVLRSSERVLTVCRLLS